MCHKKGFKYSCGHCSIIPGTGVFRCDFASPNVFPNSHCWRRPWWKWIQQSTRCSADCRQTVINGCEDNYLPQEYSTRVLDDGKTRLVLTGVPEVDEDSTCCMSGALPNDEDESSESSEPQQSTTVLHSIRDVDSEVFDQLPTPLSTSDSYESVHVTPEGVEDNDNSWGSIATIDSQTDNAIQSCARQLSDFVPRRLVRFRRDKTAQQDAQTGYEDFPEHQNAEDKEDQVEASTLGEDFLVV